MELTDEQLKAWAAQQRRAYRDGTLSSFKIKKLTKAGFVWDALKARSDFFANIREQKKQKLIAMISNGSGIDEIRKAGLFYVLREGIQSDEFRNFVEEKNYHLLLPFKDVYAIDYFEDSCLDYITSKDFSFLKDRRKNKLLKALTDKGNRLFDAGFVEELLTSEFPWYLWNKGYRKAYLCFKYRNDHKLLSDLYYRVNLVGKTVEQLKDSFGLPRYDFAKDGKHFLGWRSGNGNGGLAYVHQIGKDVVVKQDWESADEIERQYGRVDRKTV